MKPAERSGEYWSKEDIRSLEQLYCQEGIGISDIALQLGRTEGAVCQQLTKIGLLSLQGKHRTRKQKKPISQCYYPICQVKDCVNCGKERPYALIAFVVIDYITGVMCAIADKNLSSEVGFKGICRKVLIFTLVGIGNIIDVYVLGEVGVLRTAVIFFYMSNEGVSLLENAAHLGLPIPEKLKEVLQQLHNREEK